MKNKKLFIILLFILNLSFFFFLFYYIFFNKNNNNNINNKIKAVKNINDLNKELIRLILLKNFKQNKYYQKKKIKIETKFNDNNIVFNFYETNKNIDDFIIKKLYKKYIEYEKLVYKKSSKKKQIKCKSVIFKKFFENNGTIIYNYFINNKFVNKLIINNCEEFFKINKK